MTTPLGLRERKKAQTRLLLREGAQELFRRQGFEATTVVEIAAAAEVSEPTFFRYFPSKVAVALAPLGDGIDAAIDEVVARPDAEDPLEACLAVAEIATASGLVPPPEAATDLRSLSEAPHLAAGISALFDDATQRLGADFARRLALHENDPLIRQTAGVVMSTMLAVFRAWMADPDRVDIAAEAARGFQRLRRGLR